MTHQGAVDAVHFSADGRLILTGSADSTARLWSGTNGQSIGPPMAHERPLEEVGFSGNADSMSILTLSEDKIARRWPVPRAIEGDAPRVGLLMQVLTGLELRTSDEVRVLDGPTWRERCDLLNLSSPPPD
jgi:WD40 repeat protein